MTVGLKAFMSNAYRGKGISVKERYLASFLIAICLGLARPVAAQYTNVSQQGALAHCLSTRQDLINGLNGTPGAGKLLYISGCDLTFGNYVGYQTWYTLRDTDSNPPYVSSSTSERTYYFPGGVQQNTGNAGGCDGGEGTLGSACPAKKGAPLVGDPINVSIGNKYLQHDDIVLSDWLTFRRFYNSDGTAAAGGLGNHWRHNFDRSLALSASQGQPTVMVVTRPDSKFETFTKTNGQWMPGTGISDVLTESDDASGNVSGYTLFVAALRHTEQYDATGRLLSVTDETGHGVTLSYSDGATDRSVAPYPGLLVQVKDAYGRSLNLTYDNLARVHQVTLPDGGAVTYEYDATAGNLTTVQYPDGKGLSYVYDEPSLTAGANLPSALTGVVDESGTRYEDTFYDASGRAVRARHAAGADDVQITYATNGATVLYPTGISSTFALTAVQGLNKVASLDRPCGTQCNQPWRTRTYDTNGNPASYVDFNGNTTVTQYNALDLLTQEIDAQGTTNQRTTNFTWDTTLRVPLSRKVLDANNNTASNTQWVYNTTGQTLARCDIDPSNSAASGYSCSTTGTVPAGVRRSTYTYCTAIDSTQCPIIGLLLTATGPRTDIPQTTTYSYYMAASAVNCGTPGAACYQPGDLHTVTDPQGRVTTIASYDADGRITRMTDANGINTDLTYTPRGWLASRTVGGAQTSIGYTPYGAVQTVTDPDGVTTTYGYDAAHRLVKITDAQGDSVQYTLDAAGDKTAEQVYDASGTLHKSLTRTFNTLGELTKVMDGLNHTVFDASSSDSYDANGNLVHSTDGLGIQRQLGYDALNRLVQTLDNYNGTH